MLDSTKDLLESLGGPLFKEEEKQPIIKLSDEKVYGRVVFLLSSMEVTLPGFVLSKLPCGKELANSKATWSPMLTQSYKAGASYGKGSLDELREVLDHLLHTEMTSYQERQNFVGYLGSLANGLFSSNHEITFQEVKGENIEKFDSGFKPFDTCLGGLYQGVFCVAGLPGSGKTSVLLSFMNEVARKHPVWYFQTEIPSSLIQSRINQLSPQSWKGKFHAGNYSAASILEKVMKDPDPERIIIYDSPEIKVTTLDDLVYWEQTMQSLVQIKLHSKAVFVTSQIKQGITWDDLGIYSLSGSASKSRYLDGLLFIANFNNNLLVKSAKNRFGALGSSLYKYDYSTMSLEDDLLSSLFEA